MLNGEKKIHLIFDVDNTLLDTTEGGYEGLETVRVSTDDDTVFHSVVRPFARWFLELAKRHCKTVSIWTNGSKQWSTTVSQLVFPDIPWFAVLNREHSVGMNKVLQRLFDHAEYPMTRGDTYIIDDNRSTVELNPQNSIHIKPFKVNPTCDTDTAFIQIATRLGWVKESPEYQWVQKPITATTPASYDPDPFGLANQKLWCYFNAVTQSILRTPTIMRCVSYPILEWFKLIKRSMGEGTQDAGEALIILLSPLLNTPTQLVEGSTELPDEQGKDRSPMCMMYITPSNRSTSEELVQYFQWQQIDGGEGINGKKRIRSVWPGEFITGVIMVVHRNNNKQRVDRTPVHISPCVITPDNRKFHLRAIVSHSGSANLGHYVSIFFRHDGSAWHANDNHITKIDTKLKLICSQSKSASVIFYDEVGIFL